MKPVIIIGAARSGTNMLRDIITKTTPSICSWDCDEINPIWKHKNTSYKYDDLKVENATKPVKKFIIKEFERLAENNCSEYVLEKTCANSLRIPFINEIFPEAKYIILFRNGYDASISANLRWKSTFDLTYSLKKLRYVPLSDLFYYSWRFGITRLKQSFSKDKQLKVWGPNNLELNTFTKNKSLLEISAKQWSISVNETIDALKEIKKENYLIIRYENFVNNPVTELQQILDFLNLPKIEIDFKDATKKVTNKSVDKYKKVLAKSEIKLISKIIEPTLKIIDKFDN